MSALSACGHGSAARIAAANPSVEALRAGRFDEAERTSAHVIRADGGNSRARAVHAFTRYRATMHQLIADLRTVAMGALTGGINHRYLRESATTASRELAAVDADLAAATTDRDFSLELCLACWEFDWNHNGRIDDADRHLLEIEEDADGKPIAEGDPRRRPTFRFDVGDLWWARAMVSFQRALLELVLAYRWSALDVLLGRGRDVTRLVIPVDDAARVRSVRALVLAGLDDADRARLAYAAESDDDREWVPSPRQKSHPLPLPVDDALWQTWADVTSDVRNLLTSREGLDVAEVAQLGRHKWERPPHGFVDLGRLFEHPRDLVLDLEVLQHTDEAPEATLRSLLGDAYVPSLPRSRLVERLERMRGEIDRGQESAGRKLRYLLWLN